MSVFIIIIDKSRSRSILQLHNQPLSSGYGVKIRNFETMTLMWLLFWTLSFYQISSFSYYFDWRPSLGVKERHPQTRPYPTHRPNGPRCDRGQGWLEPQGSQGDTLWTDKISETDRRKTLPRHLCWNKSSSFNCNFVSFSRNIEFVCFYLFFHWR